jgi:hypothetical protein
VRAAAPAASLAGSPPSSILAANGTVSRLRPATPAAWYAGLAASLLIPLTVPLAALNVLSFVTRAAAATLVVSLPIFFGGIIFALSFRTASRASTGLAANLFGAVVGGTLEYLSMLFGIRSLNLLALVLYGASCAVLIRRPNR